MNKDDNKKLCVILFGPPLAGKGTLSRALVKDLNAAHIDMGSILRKKLAQDQVLSEKLKKGQLLDNQQVIAFFQEDFEQKSHRNLVIDGFPRTIQQAEHLHKQLKDFWVYVIELEVTLDAVINRAVQRFICGNCGRTGAAGDGICECGAYLWKRREDDLGDIPASRYRDYCDYKDGILSFYKKRGIVIPMDGVLPTEALRASVCNLVNRG